MTNLVAQRRRGATRSRTFSRSPSHGRWRILGLCVLGLLTLSLAGRGTRAADAADNENSEKRLADAVRYLAADELEGRGVGTDGLDKAADYLAAQFAALGLKTQLYDGTPFQKFTMVTGVEMGETNNLAFARPADEKANPLKLEVGKEFQTLSLGGSGKLDLPLAFVGYGITGKDEGYDDYAGIDVEGKAVIVLRREPQQDNPHSVFAGTKSSPLAPMWRKVSNAYEHGAAAVIFCNDEVDIRKKIEDRREQLKSAIERLSKAQEEFNEIKKPTLEQTKTYRDEVDVLVERVSAQSANLASEFDPLLKFQVPGSGGEPSSIPVIQCRRPAIDAVLKAALGTDLSTLEKEIDKGPTPQSRVIPGWRLTGEVTVNRRDAHVKNVVAVLEGEGPLADETIVVGAHYDHLGLGDEGSRADRKLKEIHNGADDNGSGTAALLEVARILAARDKKLPRRVVFIAFTGEERGLIGSARYCREPLYPLEKTVGMLNMDMVGRLTDEKLIIQGVDTAAEFAPIIDRLNQQYGFSISQKTGGFGPSDHSSFYSKQVPVMHFFTGLHRDYHKPSDDFDKLNVQGMRRVAEMVADTTVAIAEADARPTYVQKGSEARGGGEAGDRPYFGSIPDFGQEQPGYALSGVTKDSPADKGGLKAGDIIIKLGDSKIGNLEDFDSALRKFKAGDKVPVIVQRGKEEAKLEVTLAPPR